jgi:hypothetical protein
VAVTFAGASAGDDWGAINAVVRGAGAAGCTGDPFATLRGSTNSNAATASVGTAADGQQPDGSTGASIAPASSVKSDDRRTTTMELTHARLAGRRAGCLSLTISRKGVKDSASVPAAGVPTASPGYEIPGGGTPQTGPPPAAPGDPRSVRLATGRKLRFRKGRAIVAIVGVSRGMTGTVRLRLKNGKVLATARYTAKSSDPLTLKLRLSSAARTRLRRLRTAKATLALHSALGSTTAERRYAMRVSGS